MVSWFKHNRLHLLVVSVLASVFVMSLVESVKLSSGYNAQWGSDFWQNFSTEIMGAIVTFLLFEIVIGGRRQHDARLEAHTEQLERLIRIMQSIEHLPAANAVEELRARNWLKDGTLAGRDFKNAHLKSLHLAEANFEDCNLCHANLQDANLEDSKLEKAALEGANLKGANLTNADMCGANLRYADMSTSILSDADMRGASLTHAKMGSYSSYEQRFARLNLPDGTRWSREVYIARFTDPEHPHYQATLERINALRKKMGLPSVD